MWAIRAVLLLDQSMARRFDSNQCSDDELKFIVDKINRMSIATDDLPGCRRWIRSCGRSGYPQMKLGRAFYDRFSTQPYNPGHLLYSIQNMKILDVNGYEMSHICHNKLCIKPEHFSYEPRAINKARDVCHSSNICTSHRTYESGITYPDCLFI